MGIALSISLLSSTLLTATVSVSLGGIGRILVADSYAEFSDVQGQDGWWYGYFEGDPPFAPEEFRQFPKFIGGARPVSGRWVIEEDPGGFWTSVGTRLSSERDHRQRGPPTSVALGGAALGQ